VKESLERRRFFSCRRSSSVKDRTNIGGFMPEMISQGSSYTQSFVHKH
jgi:hypothetical protein